MSGSHRMTVGSLFAALVLVPAIAGSARADRDDRWEDWREAQEERREEMEERWEDQRGAREDWREEQRERWEDWRKEQEDRAEDYARARRRAARHHGGYYPPLPPPAAYQERWRPAPEYRYYRPHYGRYYGTRRFGFFDTGHGGTVHVGPIWVHWD